MVEKILTVQEAYDQFQRYNLTKAPLFLANVTFEPVQKRGAPAKVCHQAGPGYSRPRLIWVYAVYLYCIRETVTLNRTVL